MTPIFACQSLEILFACLTKNYMQNTHVCHLLPAYCNFLSIESAMFSEHVIPCLVRFLPDGVDCFAVLHTV